VGGGLQRAPLGLRATREGYSHICEARRDTGVDDCREACAEVVELAAWAPADVGFEFLGDPDTELRSGIALAFSSSCRFARSAIALRIPCCVECRVGATRGRRMGRER
jgi:hypothetical protein